MYQAYWNLTARPFDAGVDPRMFYPCEVHQAALLKLRYVVESRAGAALLTGASGSGKTLVARLLAERLDEQISPRVHVVYPQMPPAELLAYLAGELRGETQPIGTPGLDTSVRRLQTFLAANSAAQRHALLIIDEAHLLTGPETFEALRMLMNFQSAGQPDLSLIFVGQSGLLPMLDRLPQLSERLAGRCLLRPLCVEETMAYIEHRLALAGAQQAIFTAAALEEVHQLSQGLPRRINQLCDLALLIGYAEEQSQIDAAQVRAVAEDLVAVD